MDFQTQSKKNAKKLVNKFLTSDEVVFFDKIFDDFHVINGQWASEATESERNAPISELHTQEQSWVSTHQPDYYSMVGLLGAPTPTYNYRKEIVEGRLVQEVLEKTPNPELWCFYPDFESELLKLASKSNTWLFASGYTAKQIDKIRSFASNLELAA